MRLIRRQTLLRALIAVAMGFLGVVKQELGKALISAIGNGSA